MFGANDSTQQSNDDPAMLDNVKQLASEPADQVSAAQPQFMTSSTQQTPDPATPQAPVGDPMVTPTDNMQTSAIAEPAQGFSSSPMPNPAATPMAQTMQANDNSADDSADTTPPAEDAPIAAASMQPVDPEQLAGMKQQALDHLEPLVGHLDQSPEESFKTTMMMIQANDNHTLLEKALEEAKKIEDDKTRANAMLDIINEINYFSQTSNNS
jgi:hypothetical protein